MIKSRIADRQQIAMPQLATRKIDGIFEIRVNGTLMHTAIPLCAEGAIVALLAEIQQEFEEAAKKSAVKEHFLNKII